MNMYVYIYLLKYSYIFIDLYIFIFHREGALDGPVDYKFNDKSPWLDSEY